MKNLTSILEKPANGVLQRVRRGIYNPFWNGTTCWRSYRLIDKGKWHISWNSLLNYHNFKFSTPKPWLWFFRCKNYKDCFWLEILGFSFLLYKQYPA